LGQFDVHRLRSTETLAVDCQADLLDALNTRFVVPLVPRASAFVPAQKLNPLFSIDGSEYVMVTQFAASVPRRELGEVVATLSDRSFEVVAALDVLISGV